MNRDKDTYGRIHDKFDEWTEIQRTKPAPPPRALPPQRPYTPEPENSDMGKTLFAGIGFGIAALLLLLAGLCYYTAAQWAGYARDGAFVGYLLAGIFLTIAGVGGAVAIWNHNFRVLTRPTGHH